MKLTFLVVMSLGLGTGWFADELPSGPEAGSAVKPLSVAIAVGEKLGETLDVAQERAGKPTVYAFVRADRWDRPMARVLKGLDGAFAQGVEGAVDAGLVAVWVTSTPEASRAYLPLAQQSLKLERTRWGVFEGGANGPEGWSLNDSAGLTLVVVREGKVVWSTGYSSWNETDVRGILRRLKTE